MQITTGLSLKITRESPRKTYRKELLIWRMRLNKITKRKAVLPFEMQLRGNCGTSLKTGQKTTTLLDIIPANNNKHQLSSKGIEFGIT